MVVKVGMIGFFKVLVVEGVWYGVMVNVIVFGYMLMLMVE